MLRRPLRLDRLRFRLRLDRLRFRLDSLRLDSLDRLRLRFQCRLPSG